MANRINVPVINLLGVQAGREIKGATMTLGDKRVMDDDEDVAAVGLAIDTTTQMARYKQRTDEQSARLNAAATLQMYREQLANTQTPDEFDSVVKQNENLLGNGIGNSQSEKDFWRENREKILELNRRDVETLRREKMAEFGKTSLQQMLFDNQNVLAMQPLSAGSNLLQKGVDEIAQSPFLNDAEKEQYRTDYLKTGILNLALQSPDDAMSAAENYFPDDTDIKDKIGEVNGLRIKAEQRVKEAEAEAKHAADVHQSFKIWQQKETGTIDEAAYYVLRQQHPADNFWGEDIKRSKTPLYDAYRVIREKTLGDGLNSDEMRDVGNALICAYKQHKIGLDETIDWQNRLATATGFEKQVFATIDKIFGADTAVTSSDAGQFMENKAQRAMEFYQVYAAEKEKRVAQCQAEGGVITPVLERQMSFDALKSTKEYLGFKDGNDVSFDELKQAMKAVYYGQKTDDIWQKFYQEMPYAEDKTQLMRKVAAAAEKRELALPRFENYDEVLKAHLNRGDKFYFRGRLAEWG